MKRHRHFVHGEEVKEFSNQQHSVCPQCNKVYKTKQQYEAHLSSAHSEKNIHCPHCEFVTNKKQKLKKHIGLKHSLARFNKPWVCSLCAFATNIMWTLKAHLMDRHKQTREEADQMCQEVKVRYMQEHNGEIPAQCPGDQDVIGTPEGGMFY